MKSKDLRITKDIYQGEIPDMFLNSSGGGASVDELKQIFVPREDMPMYLDGYAKNYPIVASEGELYPNKFNVCGSTDTLTLNQSEEVSDVMNDYQGSLTSTGSLTINAGGATVKSNIDLTSLESDATYVFSIIGNSEFGYFCAINKFE